MRAAALGLILLSAAARAFAEPPSPAPPTPALTSASSSASDLHKRAQRLLNRIRAESKVPAKNPASLRADLKALQDENQSAPDPIVTQRLKLAEDNIGLLEAGEPLPPPTSDEIGDASAPDAGPSAVPPVAASPRRAPVVGGITLGSGPKIGGRAFDGAIEHEADSAVAAPVPPAVSDLGRYLDLEDGAPRDAFLHGVAGELLVKLQIPDAGGDRADYLSWRLGRFLATHPDRPGFTALSVRAEPDETLHLIYTMTDGGFFDQKLGTIDEWTTPQYAEKPKDGKGGKGGGGGGGGRRKKKAKAGKGGGGGGDGGGGSSSGGGKHGHHGGGGGHGHGGGGGGGGGGDEAGGGDDDGGGDGESASGGHHPKVPKGLGKGGFDGGDDSDSDSDVAGPSGDGASGMGGSGGGAKGGGRRGKRVGHGGGGDVAGGPGGGSSGGAGGGQGGRVHPGRSISGDDAPAGLSASSAGGPKRRRGTSVPLPKDFTSHGGAGGLASEGGPSSHGGRGGPEMELGAGPHLHAPTFPQHGGAVAAASGPAPAPLVAAGGSSPTPTAPAPMAAQAPDAPRAPIAVDSDLRDAVAAHAAGSAGTPAAIPLKPASGAPAQPEPSPSPWPLAVGVTGALFVGAAAFLRRQAQNSSEA
jgi:hypothetical protein